MPPADLTTAHNRVSCIRGERPPFKAFHSMEPTRILRSFEDPATLFFTPQGSTPPDKIEAAQRRLGWALFPLARPAALAFVLGRLRLWETPAEAKSRLAHVVLPTARDSRFSEGRDHFGSARRRLPFQDRMGIVPSPIPAGTMVS